MLLTEGNSETHQATDQHAQSYKITKPYMNDTNKYKVKSTEVYVSEFACILSVVLWAYQ